MYQLKISGQCGMRCRNLGSIKYSLKLNTMIRTLFCAFWLLAALVANCQQPKKVTLDCFFNHELRNNAEGKPERFHYLWEETDEQGFSIFGKIFTDLGAKLNSLEAAPTSKNLEGTDIYIIVDPDNLKDNPNPKYIASSDIAVIKEWVNQGGVLLLMGNDSTNCDLNHLNQLSGNFGITFSHRNRNMVKGHDFETGSVLMPAKNYVFKTTKKAYLKEISILEVKPPASALITMEKDVIMAVSRYGRGTVFAVGDPWLYNEYTNGKNIPAEYENLQAGKELAKWLIAQTKK
jgi:unsaturated rhamnogalacturonyl hydrolase